MIGRLEICAKVSLGYCHQSLVGCSHGSLKNQNAKIFINLPSRCLGHAVLRASQEQEHPCSILAKNVDSCYLCPVNWIEAELESNG